MQLDELAEPARCAELLASRLSCSQLTALLKACPGATRPRQVAVLEDALALRHEAFLRTLPICSLPSADFAHGQTGSFARPYVVYRHTAKRLRPAGW